MASVFQRVWRPILLALLSPWVASWFALGCGTAPSVPPPVARPDLASSLVWLGEQALEAGDLAAAEERFTRALEADPASVAARIGLGRATPRARRSRERGGSRRP